MKTLALIIIALYASMYAFHIAMAHPGRTDKYGGHTCRTNCKKWGLKHLEYHYHGRR